MLDFSFSSVARVAFMRWATLLMVVGVTAGGMSGCGADLAVLGAAASAASTGSSVYKRGKLNASWMADVEQVVTAAERAAAELGLELLSSVGDSQEGVWTVTARDMSDTKFMVRVERKAERLTEFQIDIGWFGQEPTARLLLKRMAVAIELDDGRSGQDGDGTAN
ncbi:MAG: DUF3568 family protein [Algisphaera sp.]